jgi:hypothetical protein
LAEENLKTLLQRRVPEDVVEVSVKRSFVCRYIMVNDSGFKSDFRRLVSEVQ